MYRAYLRRWRRTKPCISGESCCRAAAPLLIVDKNNGSGDTWPHSDIRWPTRCASCGIAFKEYDYWQLYHESIYRRADTLAEMTVSEAPAGAMWDAAWLRDSGRSPGPDGCYLHVKLPNGRNWFIDGPSRNSKEITTMYAWVRTGEIPNISVMPLVKSGEWRGLLKDGVLYEREPKEED